MNLKILEFEKKLFVLESENKKIHESILSLNTDLIDLKEKESLADDGLTFVETLIYDRRNSLKQNVEKLVTDALVAVYGDGHSLILDYGVKNSRSNVVISVNKHGVIRELDGSGGGMGGGVGDVVSTVAKIIVLHFTNKVDKFLLADEPGKHLNEERAISFGEFLKKISEKLKIQLIVCSHHNVIKMGADKSYEILDTPEGAKAREDKRCSEK